MRVLRSQSETANCPRALSNIALAVVFVEMDPGLGVAARREAVSARQQFLRQLGILEQLAVERDPDRAVLVAIGCRPPARSMIESRRAPAPRRARDGSVRRPAHDARSRRSSPASAEGKLARPRQVERTGDAAHAAILLSRPELGQVGTCERDREAPAGKLHRL